MSTELHDEKYWEAKGLGIAGRQLINGYEAIRGDLVINSLNERFIESASKWEYDDECVRRIYRKIPTPKQGDCCDRDKEFSAIAETLESDQFEKPKLPTDAKAKTYDDGKPPLARLPWAAIKELSMVQLYGQQKYGDFDNYRKGMEVTRNLSCALRHISEFLDGRDNDPESGRSHLGHAFTRIAFVLQNLADGSAADDRYKKPEKAN